MSQSFLQANDVNELFLLFQNRVIEEQLNDLKCFRWNHINSMMDEQRLASCHSSNMKKKELIETSIKKVTKRTFFSPLRRKSNSWDLFSESFSNLKFIFVKILFLQHDKRIIDCFEVFFLFQIFLLNMNKNKKNVERRAIFYFIDHL